ncbi:hypothetical protein [Shewanella xiamenensis]|uniref:hypothetical protein n=1 Tax=Shewanella xiamenensis TaxID=332186 RepID=UPI002E7C0132|nr:hypothetical protein [Shewanella xiamenensis]MEE1982597.1 hypothetical protein [Shewanella xiamenensis]
MKYEEIAKECEELSYRDKFRLAQLLIQLARKQEEEEYPVQRKPEETANNIKNITYVAERLLKLKPAKKNTLLNSIGAMFQFQGGISDIDKEKIAIELQKKNIIKITETGRVSYPE